MTTETKQDNKLNDVQCPHSRALDKSVERYNWNRDLAILIGQEQGGDRDLRGG